MGYQKNNTHTSWCCVKIGAKVSTLTSVLVLILSVLRSQTESWWRWWCKKVSIREMNVWWWWWWGAGEWKIHTHTQNKIFDIIFDCNNEQMKIFTTCQLLTLLWHVGWMNGFLCLSIILSSNINNWNVFNIHFFSLLHHARTHAHIIKYNWQFQQMALLRVTLLSLWWCDVSVLNWSNEMRKKTEKKIGESFSKEQLFKHFSFDLIAINLIFLLFCHRYGHCCCVLYHCTVFVPYHFRAQYRLWLVFCHLLQTHLEVFI